MGLLNVKEVRKLQVIEALEMGEITRAQALEHLGVHRDTLWRLQRRYRTDGPEAFAHGLRGRPSNRGRRSALRDEVVSLYREKYAEHRFGSKHFWDLAHASFSEPVPYKTVYRWLRESESVPRKRRSRRHRSRRPRKECFGELVQMDTSIHDWLGIGEPLALVCAVDDATSEVLGARLFERDTTLGNMQVMRDVFVRHGLPIGFYVDRSPIFKTTRTGEGRVFRKRFARVHKTQVQRALEEIGVDITFAYSPQAKGRIERSFGTWQDRLVSELSLEGIRCMSEANHYIDTAFGPDYNQRFSKRPADSSSAFVALGDVDIDRYLAERHRRTVTNDHVVSCKQAGLVAKILADDFRTSYAKAEVDVLRHVDHTHSILYSGRKLKFEPLEGN